METRPFTLVTVVAERLLRERLLDRIRASGAKGFTLTDVTGEGSRAIAPHEWEGPTVKIETLVTEEVAARIVDEVKVFFEHHAVILYTSEVRVARPGKFS